MFVKTYLVLGMIMRCLPTVQVVLVDEFLLTLYSILVHLVQELHAQLDVCDEGLASASSEILPNHDAEHLEVLRLRGHRVRRHDPGSNAKLMGQGKFVVGPLSLRVWWQASMC